MKRYLLLLGLCLQLAAQPAAQARPDGNLKFRFVCKLGPDSAVISTENGRAVYRYLSRGKVSLEILQDVKARNAFYRYDLVGGSGSSQQIRFVKGRYSYGIASLVIARPGGADWAALFVVQDGKLLRWNKCTGNDWFNEDHQLARLPKDPMDNLAVSNNERR